MVGLQELPAAERAKIEAPLLSEVVGDARRQGWDEKLVQAFVAVDIELWLIRNRKTGDRLFVDAAEYERIFGEPPVASGSNGCPGTPKTRRRADCPRARVDRGETPATIEERDKAIEFVQELPSNRPVLGPEDAEDWIPLGCFPGRAPRAPLRRGDGLRAEQRRDRGREGTPGLLRGERDVPHPRVVVGGAGEVPDPLARPSRAHRGSPHRLLHRGRRPGLRIFGLIAWSASRSFSAPPCSPD